MIISGRRHHPAARCGRPGPSRRRTVGRGAFQ